MWYVIWTTTGEEHRTVTILQKTLPETSYSRCWVPVRIAQQRRKGVWVEITKALFPGYIFVETEQPEKVHDRLREIPSFSMLLKSEDEFLPISQKEENMIRKLTGEKECVNLSVGILENGRVKVLRGPLVGMEEYIVRVDRHKRKAYLEMNLFQRTQRFEAGLEIV